MCNINSNSGSLEDKPKPKLDICDCSWQVGMCYCPGERKK